MALGDISIFNSFRLGMVNGAHNLGTHAYSVALLLDTFTPVITEAAPTLATYTEVLTTGNYTAGGTALTTTLVEADGVITFNATNTVTWAALALNSIDAYWGLIYNTTLGDNALGFIDLGGPINMEVVDVDLIWHPKGIFSIQVI